MCGITGIFNLDQEPVDLSLLKNMNGAIVHRGPDDEGYVLINFLSGYYKQLSGNDSTCKFKSAFENINCSNIINKNAKCIKEFESIY